MFKFIQKDLEVFTRSWEDKDFGLKLDSFREGLVKVKTKRNLMFQVN